MKHKTLFLSIAIILLVFTAIYNYIMTHPREFRFGASVSAEKLSAKPADYFVVTDPDPYLLEALSHSGTEVFAGFWDDIKIDELIAANDTNNVEYGDAYYTVQLYSNDPVYMGLGGIVLFGWIALALSFTITLISAKTKHTPKTDTT